MHQLVLASQSPRRLELLQSIGLDCQVDTVKVSEIFDENLTLEAALAGVAQRKAQALVEARKYLKGQGILVLGADTIVVVDETVLGKPKSPAQALEYLQLLSAREHRVMSGLCIFEVDSAKIWTEVETTWVRFRPLSEEELREYVATSEPLDKAGAYGIQGLGGKFVVERRGSWSNVVGLPLELLERMIKSHGWNLPRHARAPTHS